MADQEHEHGGRNEHRRTQKIYGKNSYLTQKTQKKNLK